MTNSKKRGFGGLGGGAGRANVGGADRRKPTPSRTRETGVGTCAVANSVQTFGRCVGKAAETGMSSDNDIPRKDTEQMVKQRLQNPIQGDMGNCAERGEIPELLVALDKEVDLLNEACDALAEKLDPALAVEGPAMVGPCSPRETNSRLGGVLGALRDRVSVSGNRLRSLCARCEL